MGEMVVTKVAAMERSRRCGRWGEQRGRCYIKGIKCRGATLQAFLAGHLGTVWHCLAVALGLSQHLVCVE